ncbi:polycystin-1-like protein 2 [Mytilus trossulus]|uniref:polycystin-1-like protein 2 n=1 Tax=Mytilus trossulus TaxID=6551 RepID=UPI003003F041
MTSPKVMKSSVYVNIIGKDASSGTRRLDDGTRKNFTRGTSSHFEMRLHKDLGDLKTVQVWHDNVDEKTAWLLQKITVIKAESSERYIFLCGKWLSLDSEDGKTWRSVDVLDENHIETDTLFHNLTQKKLFDDHLWVSLFKRPRCSRFTRVQRLWCLLALLFLAMISSAMWYDTPDDNKMQTISVGPLKLNYKQFYVGLMSGLIALVPSMLLVLIFKNRKFKGEKTAGCHVPWWFIFLAYILVFLCVGASGTFVFLYSLQWGGAKSLEWMVSFVLAIFQSVVILEPVKAILLAILVACLFKKMGSRELADKNMVVPVVEKTEYVTDLEKGEATITQQESCMYPDFPGLEKEEAELVVARTQAQLDKRMWSKFQSWLGMMMYVVLVALICSHSDVPTAYRQNEHLLQTISTVYTPNSTNEIYDWIKTTFNRAVYPKWWESEDDELLRPAYVQRFTLNAYNFRITLSRLRQIRVQGNCSGPDVTRNAVDTCIPTFSKKTTENRHFCTSWEEFNETDCFDENEEFQYSFLHNFGERKSAGDSTYNGQHGKYGPDGYYIDLGPKQSLVTKYLNLLQESSWIDYRTRALFLDVVTYNANTRLFSHIKIVFELPTTGSITLTTEVWSANLYPYVYAIDYLVLLLQFIFIIVMLVRFVLFIVNFYRWRTRALLRISTYLRLMELTFGIVAIVCCILRIDATISAIALLKKSIGRYVSFELVRLYDAAYNGCLAAVLFIITLDLLKPLEFNYHFFMLVSSLKIARTAIFAFIFIIALELIAFAALLYLTIGRQHELFRSMPESINTLVTVLLAMMTYESEEFDDILVKIYFGIYTMSVTITLVNVFFVLLTISFNDVKEGLKKGTLIYDEKLNAHFWYKVDKMVQWFIDRCCFSWVKRNRNELEKLQECLEKLKHMTNLMTKNDLERHKLTAKMMIKMIELDKYRTKLDCLNVQWNEFATKYIFGYGSTGETLVILSVPTLSSVVEIDIECYLVPCLRRDAVRKTKNKVCGNSFMFCTSDNKLLKGSVNLEVIYNKPNMTYNTIVTKKDKHSVWETQYSFETNTGIHASLQHIPFHFCTMETVKNESEKGIRPFEWYQVQQEGRTVFPSYDTESSVSFTKDTFKNSCSVSIRSMPGTTATILNVILEFPPEKPMRVHLPHLFEEGNNLKADHPGEYIISAKEGSEQEHIRHNSVLKKDKDGFDFLYDTRKHWKNLEVTVKSSKILWVDNFGVNSNYDINLIKAIVMVSKVRDIASKWKQIAAMLSIAVEEIDKSNDKTLCQEEKCFLVFRRWLEKEEVTFSMLTLLLTSIGHRVTAEHIRRKWIVNSPKEITKTKSKFFTKVELDNKKEKNSSANSTLTISSIDK